MVSLAIQEGNRMKKNWWIAGVAVLVAVLVIGVCVASCSTPEEPAVSTAGTTGTATSSTGPQGATVTGDEPGETSATESSADASAGSTGTSMTADGGETSVTSDGGSTTKEPTQPTTSKTKGTTKTTKGTTTTTKKTNGTTGTTKKIVVVQIADPNTGISWDGVSPIIYTYPDGSTGTVPKDGATYEQVPGVTNTYHAPVEVDPTAVKYCSHCGKVKGRGQNNTCIRWLMSAVDCPNCGEHVEPYVCHTCDK